ncbi:MAG: isoprenylcysteine carboxylmethyltransferase family protein [Rhizomicrobium sp.]|nr:isoprenylcysteine carboxylmethyltransferase family protein [Rhizomicrobium sp.]
MLPLFAIYLLWLMWLVAWLLATVAPLRGMHKLRLSEELIYRLLTLAAGALLFTLTPWPGLDVQYRLWYRAADQVLAWRLALLVGGSLSIACWALLYRQIAFSRGASIVTRGPYAMVRHPIYLCLIIAAFATAIEFGRPSSLAGASLLAIAFVCKAVIEERRTQGPAFAAYKRRALMFVPILGFGWFVLVRLMQRLKQAVARGEPVQSAPLPLRPSPPAQPAELEPPPLSRLRSVALELVLEDDHPGLGTTQSEPG